jgi:segregation and condensation protein B
MNDKQDKIEENVKNNHQTQRNDDSKSDSESTLPANEESNFEIIGKNVLEDKKNDESITQEDELGKNGEKDLLTIQKNLIEGALYAAGSPLDIEEIATKLEISKKVVEDLITELAYEYLDRSGALVIAQVGERYQMQLRPEYTESVSKFTKGGAIAEKYLRTLTIIALKQPILKSTVVKIRGTGAYEHVKYLLDNELITAEKKGRSSELMTTDKYADMFGLPKNREELKRTMVSQLGIDQEKD